MRRLLCSRAFSSSIRNVGIIAHIDAGKTTLTERILYFSGITNSVGEVHRGNTVMDFDRQERERGITISSAAVTVPWLGCSVNLLDTPGHLDFGVEVERSVRVIDAAVLVLDSVAGVQAQTETVWKQADRYSVSSVAFLNKFDREGASLDRCVSGLRAMGTAEPIPVSLPLLKGGRLIGTYDLIEETEVYYEGSHGRELRTAGNKSGAFEAHRKNLLNFIAERDAVFWQHILQTNTPDPKELSMAVERAALARQFLPVYCGSAYRNIGVQPLLDGIVSLVPDASQTTVATNCALKMLAFKVVVHRKFGILVYVRIYSGSLLAADAQKGFANLRTRSIERLSGVFRPLADRLIPVAEVCLGDIAVLTGLRLTKTGDTLASTEDFTWKSEDPLAGIGEERSFFSRSLEPESSRSEGALCTALSNIALEDPSFFWSRDPVSNAILVRGVGPLHLEVVTNRLVHDLKLPLRLGAVQVHPKEAVQAPFSSETFSIAEYLKECSVSFSPAEETACKIQVSLLQKAEEPAPPSWLQPAIIKGIDAALRRGYLGGFPLVQSQVSLLATVQNSATAPECEVLEAAVYDRVVEVISRNAPNLTIVEPTTKIVIEVAALKSGAVLSFLGSTKVGAHIQEAAPVAGDRMQIVAIAFLRNLADFAADLASRCGGTAAFSFHPTVPAYLPTTASVQAQFYGGGIY